MKYAKMFSDYGLLDDVDSFGTCTAIPLLVFGEVFEFIDILKLSLIHDFL